MGAHRAGESAGRDQPVDRQLEERDGAAQGPVREHLLPGGRTQTFPAAALPRDGLRRRTESACGALRAYGAWL